MWLHKFKELLNEIPEFMERGRVKQYKTPGLPIHYIRERTIH